MYSRSTFKSSEFIQYFNQANSGHRIYDCESFTESKFHAKNANTVKSTN